MLKLLEIKRLAGAFVIIFVSSCGGGGSTTPVNSVWNLRTGYQNFILNNNPTPTTYKFKVSGIVNEKQIAGTGFLMLEPHSTGLFETTTSAYRQDISIEAAYTVTGGSPAVSVLSSTLTNWYSLLYGAIGEEHAACVSGCVAGLLPSEYITIGTSNSLPQTATSGNSGTLYQGSIFSDSTKTTQSGTIAANYVLKADNAGNATFDVTVIEKNMDNTINFKRVMNYLINSDSNMTLIGLSLTDSGKDIRFNN